MAMMKTETNNTSRHLQKLKQAGLVMAFSVSLLYGYLAITLPIE